MLKTFQDLYAQKEYIKALQVLNQNAKDLDPGLYHYNAGTTEVQLGNWSIARYHFLMADNSGFDVPKNSINLKLVEEKLEIPRLEKPLNTMDYVVQGSLILSQGLLTTISLITLLIGLVVVKKKPSTKAMLSLLGLVLVPLGLNFWIRSWPMGVVTQGQIIYEGPSAIFASRDELPPGILILSQPNGEWRKIIYPSRFTGWIKNKNLKVLE